MTEVNLRNRASISSYEPQKPDLDEYLYCDKCGDFVYEYCSIHGPLLIIPDNEVQMKTNLPSDVPRSALTIPNVFLHLASSIIPGAGLGVFSTLALPRGVRFGPYRGLLSNDINSMYCWQIYDRNHKPSHVIDAEDADKSNWMRYVNCARHWREQNLVAYQYQGQLYYRTIKTIPRYTELMVFYGSEFASQLQIDLQRYTREEHYQRIIGATLMVIEDCSTTEIKSEGVETEESVSNYSEKGSTVTHSAVNEQTVNSNKKDEQDITNCLQLEDRSIGTFKMNFDDSNLCLEHGIINDINTNKIIHQCHYCDRQLSTKVSLRRHLIIHSDYKPYACTQCYYKTSIKYDLTRHIKTHERNIHKNFNIDIQKANEPFKLNVHKKSFENKTHLNELVTNHFNNLITYNCAYCNFKTIYKKNHTRHISGQHTKEKIFSCDSCSYTSYLKCNLNKHIQRKHDKYFYEKKHI